MKESIIKTFEQHFAKLGAAPGDEFNGEMREMLALIEEYIEAQAEDRAVGATAYMCRRRARNGFCFEKATRCDRDCEHTTRFCMNMRFYENYRDKGELTEKVNQANARIQEFIQSGKLTLAKVFKENSTPRPGAWSERTE